jgi:hypothetical protein
MERRAEFPVPPYFAAALAASVLLAPGAARAQESVAGHAPGVPPAVNAASLAPTSAGEPVPPAGFVACGARIPRTRVAYDDQGGDGIWARGETYKAGFSGARTVYAPFLGSKAPRDYPVTLRVASASVAGLAIEFDATAPPRREADSVRYARGGFDEVYELGLDSIEQSFVFEHLPARGELIVRLAAETELSPRETAEELRFENELGAVRYGRATVLDASGASSAAPTALTQHGIEIRVPAEFVAHARMPLVIDPVIATFTVDNSSIDSYFPDVAYDSANDQWLVAYEETFSSTDHDIHYRLLNASGVFLHEDWAELSITQNWKDPAVAYNRRLQNFMIVAATGFAPNRVIQGRRIAGGTGFPSGAPIVISTSDLPGDKQNPDIGGDPRPTGSTLYCVVWEHVWNSVAHDIDYRMVSPEGSLQGTNTLAIDNSSGPPNRSPSISKSNGGEEWNVAWQRDNAQVRGARISNTGALVVIPFVIDSSGGTLVQASTSLAGTDQWIVAYQFGTTSDQDIGLRSITGSTVEPYGINLSGYEQITGLSTTWNQQQVNPDIDSDGETFLVVYCEAVPGSSTNFNIYGTSVALTGTRIAVTEGHVGMGVSLTREDFPKVVSRGGAGGALQRYMTVWHDVVAPSVQTDIKAGLYDAPLFTPFCVPALIWTIGCPCSNPPSALDRGCNNSASTGGAKLVSTGMTSLAADTAFLQAQAMLPNALAVFNQGNAVLTNSVSFGQGIRCVGGSLKRLYTKTASGGVASAPQSGDPSISARSAAQGDTITPGSTRGYYVYYRDPQVLGGCSSASTFNTTQSLQAVWVP